MTKEATLKPVSTSIPAPVISRTPGRLRLKVSQPHRQPAEMKRIANALNANPQINDVRTNIHNGSITIYHERENGSLDNVFATLRDLDIIFGELTQGKSEAAEGLTNAAFDLNKRVEQATNGAVDLRFLIPLGLGTLGIRQLLTKGLQLEIIPWYVLVWYAFDSFIKLHYTKESGGARLRRGVPSAELAFRSQELE